MKVRIEITVGDKIVANEYQEPDRLLALHHDARASIEQAKELVWQAMGDAITRSLEEMLAKRMVAAPRDDQRFIVT